MSNIEYGPVVDPSDEVGNKFRTFLILMRAARDPINMDDEPMASAAEIALDLNENHGTPLALNFIALRIETLLNKEFQ